MKNVDTKDLEKAIKEAKTIEKFNLEFGDSLGTIPVNKYLNDLIESRKLKKSAVIKDSRMSETYAYQIFSGVKRPSRDKLLSLAVAIGLGFDECQLLLREAFAAPLYLKNKRDAAIAFGLENKMSVAEIDDLLFQLSEHTLSSDEKRK